jgi:hypothetical protein
MGMTKQERQVLMSRPEVEQALADYQGDRAFFEDVFVWASLAMDPKGDMGKKYKEFGKRVQPAIEMAGVSDKAANALINWENWGKEVTDVVQEWFRILDDDMYEYHISICITQANMNNILRSGMKTDEMTAEDKAKTVKLHKDALMDLHEVIKKKREVVNELYGDSDAARAVRKNGAMKVSPEGFAQ